jgi:hypothetical protein
MKNISFFCLTLNPDHEEIIKKLSYMPVGLGDKEFSKNCFSDKQGINISSKNSFYGEYTFHYWLWKNYLDLIKTEWIGFCQYRKFFVKKKNINTKNLSFIDLKDQLITEIDNQTTDIDCILGDKFSVSNYKFSKIMKRHFFHFLTNPDLFFNKKKRNLELQFNLFHGKGNLDLAINLLDQRDRHDFKNFMYNQNCFNPHNMFACKTKLLRDYYETIFPWLEKCEKVFGFSNLKGYGSQRIYGFLAERFLSYWFTKNYKFKELPIIGKDLSDYKNL